MDELYHRPGFLLRRAHQICVALFLEETRGRGLTPTQYDIMVVLRALGSLDQVGIAKWSGIDRSTSGLVISKLENSGYVTCSVNPVDERRKIISLSAAGHDMLVAATVAADRACERALKAFSARDGARFRQLLHAYTTFSPGAHAAMTDRNGRRRTWKRP